MVVDVLVFVEVEKLELEDTLVWCIIVLLDVAAHCLVDLFPLLFVQILKRSLLCRCQPLSFSMLLAFALEALCIALLLCLLHGRGRIVGCLRAVEVAAEARGVGSAGKGRVRGRCHDGRDVIASARSVYNRRGEELGI